MRLPMKSHRNILATLLFAFVASACATPERTVNTPATLEPANASSDSSVAPSDIVKVSVAPINIKRGANDTAQVRLTIAEGFHINANPPTLPHLIPTQLSVQTSDGLTAAQPAYPNAVTRKFKFEATPLAVYEGTVEINLPMSATRDATTGKQRIAAHLRVQPCNDGVCYPPQKIDVMLPVIVE